MKRTYIPKKKNKLRPLDIKSIIDKTIQGIVTNVLEPKYKQKADRGSSVFRSGRSCRVF